MKRNGGEVFNDYSSNTIDNEDESNVYAHAEGCYTTAGWRSHAEGYMTLANNTSHAEGRLGQATGKGSHAEGIESYEDVVYASTTEVVTVEATHIDATRIEVISINPIDLSEGDYIVLNNPDGDVLDENFVCTDAKRVLSIDGDYENSLTEGLVRTAQYILIDSPFRAENYYEGHNCPEDGYIPRGAKVQKVTGSTASGECAHAEGCGTLASSKRSHAQNYRTVASGESAHAEGGLTTASGVYAHSEGFKTVASGYVSHAEGREAVASNNYAHAEGYQTTASGYHSHSEGESTTASGQDTHAEGRATKASGHYSHAQGWQTESRGQYSHSEGRGTIAVTNGQHVQGTWNVEDTEGVFAHVLGNGTSDTNRSNAHTIDWSGNAWFAGKVTVTSNATEDMDLVTLEQLNNVKSKLIGSSSEGNKSEIFNDLDNNRASGSYSHAEGFSTAATGTVSHAEGNKTVASGNYSHSEGSETAATGKYSHVEGQHTLASGEASHAEGQYNTAKGAYAHAEGFHTLASSTCQHVQGKYNIEDTSGTYADIVGNGTSSARSNAYTLDWEGNAWYSGRITADKGIQLIRGINYGTQEELDAITDPFDGQLFIIIE